MSPVFCRQGTGSSAATDQGHDFQVIPGLKSARGMQFPRDDIAISFHRTIAAFDFQVSQEIGDRPGFIDRPMFAVQLDVHGILKHNVRVRTRVEFSGRISRNAPASGTCENRIPAYVA